MRHRFTREQLDFLRKQYVGRTRAELKELFNAHYGETVSQAQIVSAIKNYNMRNGLNGRFSKGGVPHNKGKKGCYAQGCQATWFPKGHRPKNYKPIGSERVNRDGYLEVKVEDPKKWRPKHLLIWEAANGPIPKGHAVVFGDGDRQNLDLDNLVLLTRGELAVMNKKGLLGGSVELTRTGQAVARLKMAATRHKKARKETKA